MANRIWTLAAVLAVAAAAPAAHAQVVYQVDSFPPPNNDNFETFNNSQGAETEDDWVANSFQVVPLGTRLTSFSFIVGQAVTNQSVTASIYTGSSLTNPQAGGGLTRVASATGTLTTAGRADFLRGTADAGHNRVYLPVGLGPRRHQPRVVRDAAGPVILRCRADIGRAVQPR